MSLYKRYAQDPATHPDGFELDKENIEKYHNMAIQMDEELRWIKSYISIKQKLDNPEQQDDYLYTPEYLTRRMEKLTAQHEMDDTMKAYMEAAYKLEAVNDEIKVVFPKAMDKELGKDPAVQERMSVLNDQRIEYEDALDAAYGEKYADLKKNLKKIYYMILEGVDMQTVNQCFRYKAMVLSGNMDYDQAEDRLMDESVAKYNLPKGIYDPLKKQRAKANKKGKKK